MTVPKQQAKNMYERLSVEDFADRLSEHLADADPEALVGLYRKVTGEEAFLVDDDNGIFVPVK